MRAIGFAALGVFLPLGAAHADNLLGLGAAWTVRLDCSGGTITRNEQDRSLTLCVPELTPARRRCEVEIQGPDIRGQWLEAQFDVKLNEAAARPKQPIIIFQIHSRPDPGEQWRCPIAALRALPNNLELGGAYDFSEISRPAANGCIGPESTIKGYRAFLDKPATANTFMSLRLRYRLSLRYGDVVAFRDGKEAGEAKGPNMMNDKTKPFLKMGIYGVPSEQPGPFCSTIRNVKLDVTG